VSHGPRPVRDGIPASRLQLPPGPWTTLLQALCAQFPGVDEPTWRERFARGRVLDAQGQVLDVATPYRCGAEVQYFREVMDEPVIPFAETVVHADAQLLVVNKPHFLPVAPTGAYLRETLLTRLLQRYGNPDLVPLHRLDRDTAGLMLFSTDRHSRAAYQALFRERRIDKRYLALAPPLPQLNFPHLHRSRLQPGEPFFRMAEVAGEANSETVIELLARGDRLWTYRLQPITGRKHQLRVHMAAIGAPIHNDRCYPLLQPAAKDDFSRPLALFAQSLAFVDPLTGESRCFSATPDWANPQGGSAS
jgi:tRNA pseudouridine32 synthase / 23S rRNA pseudouridine746 synthase